MSERLRAQLGLVSALLVLITTMLVLIRGSIDNSAAHQSGFDALSDNFRTQPTQLANTTR
jgi:hypothetical protein